MYLIRQCLILFGCLAAGEVIVLFTEIPLPSSIIGMLLLFLALVTGILKLQWIKGLTDILLSNISFFFIPSGVALMMYFDVIRAQWMPIIVSIAVSFLLVVISTGVTHTLIAKLQDKIHKKKSHLT